MSVKLYMDQHVRSEVTDGLRDRGIDVLTAFEDGTSDWDDEDLLERASQLDRVLFTQDADFLEITARWAQAGRDFSGLVYGPQLRISIGEAIRDLELIATAADPAYMRNRVEYLPF